MKPKVLFLCTGNSARSQMAEGYLRHRAGDQYEVLSAGIDPKGLNPLATEAMRELDIDISSQTSKNAAQFLGTPVHYVITVCDNAREHCPIFPGTFKYLHWSFPDPAAVEGTHDQKLTAFRTTRDAIAKRIDEELISRSAQGTQRKEA
jgi:arsenate reductase (thioredoxin)